jgi:hypothetical protein
MPKVAEQVVPADPLDRSNFGSKEQRTAFPIERRDIFQRAAELCRWAALCDLTPQRSHLNPVGLRTVAP